MGSGGCYGGVSEGGILIRPYRSGDRSQVHRIAADTAFFGEPVERFLEDRRLFCDAFVAYYTDCEPERGWVACAGHQVAGYLVGCLDSGRQQKVWLRCILPLMTARKLAGGYRWGRRTQRYVLASVRAMLAGDLPEPDLDLYPAHLHVNLDAGWRGLGLGRQLLTAYLDQLRGLAAPGVHLHTTSFNQAACRLYERFGFRMLDERPGCLWSCLTGGPVFNRCYGLQLRS